MNKTEGKKVEIKSLRLCETSRKVTSLKLKKRAEDKWNRKKGKSEERAREGL